MMIKKILCASLIMGAAMLCDSASAQESGKLTLFVGTALPASENGIQVYEFDPNDATVTKKSEVSGISNPTYLAVGLDQDMVYAVSENEGNAGALYAYSFNPETSLLTLVNSQPTKGAAPCYVCVSPDSLFVATANYNGRDISLFPLKKSKGLHEASIIKYIGGTPESERQSEPHPHSVYPSPDFKYLMVNDLGTDNIYIYKYDEAKEGKIKIGMRPHKAIKLDAGEGPRHTAFHPNNKYAYVIGELSGNVGVYKYDDGNLNKIQSLNADDAHASGSADIHLSPDGKFLYVSNRLKDDGIAIFKVFQTSGRIEKIGYQYTGIHPRNFIITPNGKYLLVACRDSDIVEIYERDKETGKLTKTDKSISVQKPMCVKFLQSYE
jgi:6-phosphogluconolactonase (cycloisomerase 2 family)